jgi:hypothetical protein
MNTLSINVGNEEESVLPKICVNFKPSFQPLAYLDGCETAFRMDYIC